MGAAQHSEGGVRLSDVETLPGDAMMVSDVVPGVAMMVSEVIPGDAVMISNVVPGVAMMVSEVVPGDAVMISNVVSGVAVDVPWSRYHREGSPGPQIWVRPRVLYDGEGLVVIT